MRLGAVFSVTLTTRRRLPEEITHQLLDEFGDVALDLAAADDDLEESYPLTEDDQTQLDVESAAMDVDEPSAMPPATQDEEDLIAASMADVAPALFDSGAIDGKLSSVPEEEPMTRATIDAAVDEDVPDAAEMDDINEDAEAGDELAADQGEGEVEDDHPLADAKTLSELLAGRPSLSTIEARCGSVIAERALELLDNYEEAALDKSAIVITEPAEFRASLELPPIAVPAP